jgi:phage-related protein
MNGTTPKPIEWVGSSKEDLRHFPDEVKDEIGYALYQAQLGRTPRSVKPLKGYGGASILEVIESFDGNTYRAVYTVRFIGFIYVLHVFQKKSKHGDATPRTDLALIRKRLRVAEQHYKAAQQRGE